jgi:hypothetical protein
MIHDPIIRLWLLEPASASVPAAAKNEQNEDDDDEKGGVVHVALLALEFVISTQSFAGRPARVLRKRRYSGKCSVKRRSKQSEESANTRTRNYRSSSVPAS